MRAARYHGVRDIRIEELPDDTTIANMAAGHYETEGWVEHIPLDDLLAGFDDLRAGRKMKIHVDL